MVGWNANFITERVKFMSIYGLEVKGLDSTEISQKLEMYVAECFNGYKLDAGQSMFQEGYTLHFDEVADIIPSEHHHLFTNESKFNGMSGYITTEYVGGGVAERTVMLLMDGDSENVYLLYLQETNQEGEERTTLIKDFLIVT